ncbi:Dyp-type peroxidase [Actinomyces haliotis]|uniref:Dyp-type peroxidase n=1 Tax=Actinomyces haliotis TaxID=1280843 RepID=UPI00188E1302|nr:Dyp-type peroxidase [Actinomyces haliotis]
MTDANAIELSQAVLGAPAKASIFLTLTIREGGEARVLETLPEIESLTHSVAFRSPEAGVSCVVGIGARAWDRLFETPRPERLHVLEPVTGSRHSAPSTPGDLFLHVRSQTFDTCFEVVREVTRALGDAVRPEDEVHGFRYRESRDPLGFVDGTESPEGREAVESALVPEGKWAGGSYIIEQRYTHDLTAWDALSTREQELVIGRTKMDDVELDDDVKPHNSHVALNTVEDAEGNEHKIVRDNLAFGNASGEQGTFFMSYAADPRITELMLRRMFIGEPEGNYDRILDFSTAVTGALFFAPPADFLDDAEEHARPGLLDDDEPEDPTQPALGLPQAAALGLTDPTASTEDVAEPLGPDDAGSAETAPPAQSAPTTTAPTTTAPADGSLGIGSLRG